MKSILYIGNKLEHKNSNVSSIQTSGSLLEKEGYKIYYASSKVNKVMRLLDMIFSFFKYSKKVDYVIIDTYSTQNFYYALIISQLCRFFKVKYIPSLNGGNLPARLKNHPKLSELIFKHAHINISPSLYLVSEFKKYGYDKVTFIPNSIEINNYKFERKEFDTIRLLWVRSFSKIYNPTMAISVVKVLKKQNYNVSLCMVGPDSDGALKITKDFAKQNNVSAKFTGKLPKNEWIALAKHYNIFINTTNFDNMPVSVIEAMALGLPVVSTNVGGIPYLIEDGKDGLLVEKSNISDMADAIKEIVTNPDLSRSLALSAKAKVERFNWSVVKAQWRIILR